MAEDKLVNLGCKEIGRKIVEAEMGLSLAKNQAYMRKNETATAPKLLAVGGIYTGFGSRLKRNTFIGIIMILMYITILAWNIVSWSGVWQCRSRLTRRMASNSEVVLIIVQFPIFQSTKISSLLHCLISISSKCIVSCFLMAAISGLANMINPPLWLRSKNPYYLGGPQGEVRFLKIERCRLNPGRKRKSEFLSEPKKDDGCLSACIGNLAWGVTEDDKRLF